MFFLRLFALLSSGKFSCFFWGGLRLNATSGFFDPEADFGGKIIQFFAFFCVFLRRVFLRGPDAFSGMPLGQFAQVLSQGK